MSRNYRMSPPVTPQQFARALLSEVKNATGVRIPVSYAVEMYGRDLTEDDCRAINKEVSEQGYRFGYARVKDEYVLFHEATAVKIDGPMLNTDPKDLSAVLVAEDDNNGLMN